MAEEIISALRKRYQNKKVLVVGLGLQGGGVGIASFFAELGSQVTVTDLKTPEELRPSLAALSKYSITYRLGKHNVDDFRSSDLIFKAPKMRWDSPEIAEAMTYNIPVEMESSFFASYSPATVIGVTGTRGKTTTASMIYDLLQQSGVRVFLAGNIPNISTINLLKEVQSDDYVVLELSSWQLSAFHRDTISPQIGVFTSFYPDHLDYYHDMDEYYLDKAAIYLYQKMDDYAIINEQIRERVEAHKPKSRLIYFSSNDFPGELTYLKGEHNKANAAAALSVARTLSLEEDKAKEIIRQFKGVPDRQEIILTKNNITFVNDTTATTPVATIKAIETFSDKPLYLIFGGNTKKLPVEELLTALEKTSKIILLQGTLTNELLYELEKRYQNKITPIYNDLEQAVKLAYKLAQQEANGAYVVLSPAATSFAMFNNEFHRGAEFKRLVQQL